MFQHPTQALLQVLTEQQAIERLATDGYNELPTAHNRNFLHILLEVLREPMFLMLIACGVLYLFLGDQEQKTERALDALRGLFQLAPLHRCIAGRWHCCSFPVRAASCLRKASNSAPCRG